DPVPAPAAGRGAQGGGDRHLGRLLRDLDRPGAAARGPSLDLRARPEARRRCARRAPTRWTSGPRHRRRRPGERDVAEPGAQAPFDAVFVDADKGGYQRYGEWATQTLRPGGLLIGDNTYLFGRLVGGERPGARPVQPEEQASMRGFHELLAARYEAVCLPTPDGLAVGMLRAPGRRGGRAAGAAYTAVCPGVKTARGGCLAGRSVRAPHPLGLVCREASAESSGRGEGRLYVAGAATAPGSTSPACSAAGCCSSTGWSTQKSTW